MEGEKSWWLQYIVGSNKGNKSGVTSLYLTVAVVVVDPYSQFFVFVIRIIEKSKLGVRTKPSLFLFGYVGRRVHLHVLDHRPQV